ncbi:MAG TPA: FAD-binding protein [Thermoanaerobaculia bacterium]|nr:FAD-binding protein [Thermoanaerobaculia bacterium]
MSEPDTLSRRTLLRGTLAAAAVVGFDPLRRCWATEADAAAVLVDDFPLFDGDLLVDEATLAAAADDFGHQVSRRPLAVLRPGSVDDVVRLVRFCRRHRIGVAARGQGHTTDGQAQVDAGVVIDMSPLDDVGAVGAGSVWVGAGVTWNALLQATLPHGVAPPVLTDYIDLSVGGTLAVGGVGSQSFRFGAQVDNVLALTVVTGRGELVTCSATTRRRLFHAVLAGLGQFAVVVRARLRLVPAPPMTRFYRAIYDDLSALLADQRTAVADGRFDTVQGFAEPDGASGYLYVLEANKGFTPGAEPDDAALLAGLGFLPGQVTIQDLTWYEYLNRLAPIVELLQQIGVWFFPHPWLDVFLPDSEAEAVIAETLAATPEVDLQGPVLIYAFPRASFGRPFFRLPDEEGVVMFSLLRTAVPPTPERAAELTAANRVLFERAVAAGGNAYPISAFPERRNEWRRHYGESWPLFQLAKLRWDPARILAPGREIFAGP